MEKKKGVGMSECLTRVVLVLPEEQLCLQAGEQAETHEDI